MQADPHDKELAETVRSLRSAAEESGAQVILATAEPLPEEPEGVDVVVFPSAGQGDRYDAAAEVAHGDLLAFVDARARITPEWISEALVLFSSDPELVVAGGPVLPVGHTRGERVGALVMKHCLRGTPTAHNSRMVPSREVREVGLSNMIVRADSFRAVGGFQSPARAHEESTRLCYKVRTLASGKIVSDPRLALYARAPSFPLSLLRNVTLFGRSRGDMARRLPMAVPLLPYAVPSMIAVGLGACVAALIFGRTVGREVGLAILGVLLITFLTIELADSRNRSGSMIDKLFAVVAAPVVVFAYGMSFVRGYFGKSLGDISPPRDRQAPLRVLIFNWRDVTHPHSGGAETYMHQIARRWAAEGLDVGWLTQHHAGSKRSEVIDRIRIYRVGGKLTQYPLASVAYLLRLRRRYDVLVDCENGIPFFTPLYSRRPKILVVHHVHQEIFRTQLPKQLSWLALWLEGWFMPRVYRKARVVAVSEGTKSDLLALGFSPERVTIITNGVFPPSPVPAAPAKRPTILCMGRLKPQKSVDVLIRALPALVARFPDLHLDVVGQGPDRCRLERLAWATGLARHVRFHGYVAASVRDRLSAEAWLAVCPSSFEGWGVVCMEASSHGLPVVASDVPGLRESVRDGETGLLFPYGDVDALAEAVGKLLDDRELRARMGRAGVQWAARHTWDGSAATFASVLGAEMGERPVGADSPTRPALASWV
jgi:glycosyltransferase involved in cell wall biosynthesis